MGGFYYWTDRRETHGQLERDHLARVMARVWVGSAERRENPQAFLQWRDSLLATEGLTAESMAAFLRRYESNPYGYEEFTRLVSDYVDSLTGSEAPSPDAEFPDSLDPDLFVE